MMRKLEIAAIVIGAIAGAMWYWWRDRKATPEPDGMDLRGRPCLASACC